jgi:hypothetical protein
MANYVKATNFFAKDALLTGDPAKIIKGAEIDDEYNAIATAIATKANLNSPEFTGVPIAPTAAFGTSTTQLATTKFVQDALPPGLILLWSGSIANIPAGWTLCNGSNGTPDLRDRFVVGAGSTYAVNATGGSKDAIVVEHTHSVTDPGHTHSSNAIRAPQNTGANYLGAGTPFNGALAATIDSATTGLTVNSTGSSGTNANLPPYFALCYIMKT